MAAIRRNFDHVLRMLRKECPLKSPMRVVSRDLQAERLCGSCSTYLTMAGEIDRFVIEIDSNLNQVSAIDTLLHEWAHAMDLERYGLATESHRDSWGRCYARVWRAYVAKTDSTN